MLHDKACNVQLLDLRRGSKALLSLGHDVLSQQACKAASAVRHGVKLVDAEVGYHVGNAVERPPEEDTQLRPFLPLLMNETDIHMRSDSSTCR